MNISVTRIRVHVDGALHEKEFKGAPERFVSIAETDLYRVEIRYDAEEELKDAKHEVFCELASVYFEANKTYLYNHYLKGATLLEAIGNHSIDIVLGEVISNLIKPGNYERAAIFFLNEALMELRGVVFGQRGFEVDTTSLEFRSKKIKLNKKNILSDIMFFKRSDTIDLSKLDNWGPVEEFIDGEVTASSLGIGTRPTGVLMVKKDVFSPCDLDFVSLYASIISLSMEFTNIRSELERYRSSAREPASIDYISKDLVKMGKLAATVAHELKNPLVAIGGFAKRLASFCNDPRTENYVRMIQSEVGRLENLVSEILDYSKNVDLKFTLMNLKDVTDEITNLLREKFSVNMVHVSTDVEPGLKVLVDPDRFKQVLINIIINGIQAMPDGGDLKISAEHNEEKTILYIKDSGGGVALDDIEKIFEPFHTTKKDGTGLGLPLSKKIMTAHGGDIVVSNDESGAVFALILPRHGGIDE
ncbi:sensor histidine kinase [Limisalsivibrio acetivorans]|uniref:sensor histidine kinase n=1 Tax=Limisalsivibrio acetivorans TaxID=1304888 RepID=UPI00138ABF34|nr:ATP-binding protein [Limisalsivibrio acetivorans]